MLAGPMHAQPVHSAPAVPRRASLVVPASSPEMLAKAATRGADEVVLDLEDAVVPTAKDAARASATDALAQVDWGPASVAVRVNAPRTPWCHADLEALARAAGPLRSIVVPKVESAGDVAFVERLLDGVEAACERATPLRVQALIETAAGVARVEEIAGASPRVEALLIGYADLAASLGRTADGAADPLAWDAVRDAVLVAARTHGLQALDGPYLGLQPDAAFLAAARRARDAGFDGKWAIHPAQVAPLLELFAPGEDEVTQARAIIDALDEAERVGGRGAVALDGQMLDEAVRVAALRTLARAGVSNR